MERHGERWGEIEIRDGERWRERWRDLEREMGRDQERWGEI